MKKMRKDEKKYILNLLQIMTEHERLCKVYKKESMYLDSFESKLLLCVSAMLHF